MRIPVGRVASRFCPRFDPVLGGMAADFHGLGLVVHYADCSAAGIHPAGRRVLVDGEAANHHRAAPESRLRHAQLALRGCEKMGTGTSRNAFFAEFPLRSSEPVPIL